MKCWHDDNITCFADCELIENCPDRARMTEIRADAIYDFSEKLADNLESFEVDFPDCKNVSICTVDGVIEKIFEIAEQLKEQK